MELKDLNNKDIELIKQSMLEHTVTLVATCQECKDVMPKEAYTGDMNKADRLIYLVNVMNGQAQYDNAIVKL